MGARLTAARRTDSSRAVLLSKPNVTGRSKQPQVDTLDRALLVCLSNAHTCTTWFYCSLRTDNQRPTAACLLRKPKRTSRCTKDQREHLEKSMHCAAYRKRIIGIREKSGSTPLHLLHADARTARLETAPVTSSPLSLASVLRSSELLPTPGLAFHPISIRCACVHALEYHRR